jgi:ethanolamine utilization protein EutJ
MALALRPEMTAPAARAFLESASACYRSPAEAARPPLRFGIDLGTATIVLTAAGADGRPVYWDFVPCAAVRDGVVVDFAAAVREVRTLKTRAESLLGCAVESAATAALMIVTSKSFDNGTACAAEQSVVLA